MEGAEALSVKELISDKPNGFEMFVVSGNVVCTGDTEQKSERVKEESMVNQQTIKIHVHTFLVLTIRNYLIVDSRCIHVDECKKLLTPVVTAWV